MRNIPSLRACEAIQDKELQMTNREEFVGTSRRAGCPHLKFIRDAPLGRL